MDDYVYRSVNPELSKIIEGKTVKEIYYDDAEGDYSVVVEFTDGSKIEPLGWHNFEVLDHNGHSGEYGTYYYPDGNERNRGIFYRADELCIGKG